MKTGREIFTALVEANRRGESKGIYSVCSANSDVLEACFTRARIDGTVALVESTSNQVDQYGGYTGMRPADFVRYVKSIAAKTGLSEDMILLGGDHLGPNPWKDLPAREAMERAKILVAEYVKEGYQKIHLDTSMFCADDAGDRTKPLDDEIVAQRGAILCKTAEEAWKKYRPASPAPVYVIGTEVPIPGGAQEEETSPLPTTPEDAAKTIAVVRKCFLDGDLSDAWERVVGVVVQPGVEFGDDEVFRYDREKAAGLSKKILEFDGLVFEAHSTDYQAESKLKALVEDHFAILKVGPWLTFAYREALFALEAMEIELLGTDYDGLSNLRGTLDEVMINHPEYWGKYYRGDARRKAFKRKYSFSDRSRYYWLAEEVTVAREKLFRNLRENKIPLSLLSQYMPSQFYRVCEGLLEPHPEALVRDHIGEVVAIYSRACGLSREVAR